jgi:putative membrane protein
MKDKNTRVIQIIIFTAVMIWSVIKPYDMATWFMEALPALAAFAALAYTYKKFRFAEITYWFILVHCIILFIGAHYTYARVPLFDWFKDAFDLSRNNYDKLGHLAQGFIPAMVIREILIRTSPLRTGKWLFFIVSSIALAISASYEIIEWWTAIFYGDGSIEFLGLQGYIWDAQSDMFLALIGSIISQIIFMKMIDTHACKACE